MSNRLRRLRRFDRGLLCQVALAGVVALLLVGLPAHAQMNDSGAQDPAQMNQVQAEQGDPPSEVARLSVANGNVSVEPASVDQFSQAESNYPLTTGDRVYADAGATTEIETGQLAVRLGQQTDLTVTALTDTLAQFGLAQGSVHLRSFGLNPGTTVELDTPNVAVTVLQPGDIRVDVDPDGNTTVWLIAGQVQVDGNGLQQMLEAGQRVRLEGSDAVSVQWLDAGSMDGLDRFSADRDEVYAGSMATEAQDVNPEMTGAADLGANGDWETDADEGPVWYPSGVAVGWEPYSCGRWAWVAPWGWTWIECEAWGFAPFHYGRWENRRGRWGWIPGPPVVRPVYSPAMVAFVGGAGVTAWFPLGPHEPYIPWYHASSLYLNRVNVSNIYSKNLSEVRNLYNQRAVANQGEAASAYVVGGEHGYVNRPLATVAVSQASFAAGKPVARSMVHVAPEQLAAAPVLAHPMVTPERTLVISTPARAVPARMERPTLASRADAEARPAEEAVAPAARTPVVRPQPEQTPVSAAPAAGQRPLFHNAVPPAPRPSFDEQQKAIQTNDPGRPLGPEQMENLRQNKPAGPPQQREMPHPAPAPRYSPPPAPAPRSAPAPAAGSKH